MSDINFNPSQPILPGVNLTGTGSVDATKRKASAAQNQQIVDSQAQSNLNKVRSRNLLLQPNLPSALNLSSLLGPSGAGNAYGKPSSMTALVIAMSQMSKAFSEMRFSSEEASTQAGLMILNLGLEAAQRGWEAAVKQSEIHKANAQGHFHAAWIAGASAVVTIGGFAAMKGMNARARNNDEQLQMARQDTAAAKTKLNTVSSDRTIGGGSRQGPKQRIGPLPKKGQDEVKADYQKKLQAENERSSQIDNQFMAPLQTLTSVTTQFSQMGQEIVKGITEQEVAGLTLEKGRAEKAQQVVQTYQKVMQRLEQSAEQDAKDAREMLAKYMQELTQMIDQQYKAYNIGVHG